MDTALQLKIEIDKGKQVSKNEAVQILKQSELVSKLTCDLIENPLFYVWRIIALSEIPETKHLNYTNNLIDRVYEKLATPFGFSLSGDEKMFLPCYNAMVISAMCRLGRSNDEQVKNAINWINTNQPMERGIKVSIPNFRFDRFGGCYKNTPCYIGLAKSVIALLNYQKATHDTSVDNKLRQGIEYILEHQFAYRLSKNIPITNHILDISFPESYHLNVVELIRFASEADLLQDERTARIIDYLQNSKLKKGNWKINYRYKAEGYTVFDKDWVTYIINKALYRTTNNITPL